MRVPVTERGTGRSGGRRRAIVALAAAAAMLAAVPSGAAASDPLADPASFASPPNEVRPKWRWWWAAPYDTAETRRELQAMYDAGFSGAEIAYDQSSWATPEQRENLRVAMQFAREHDFEIDMTIGASWPIGTPETGAGTGLAQQELQYGRADVAGGTAFSGPVPPPLDDPANEREGELVAVTAARVVERGPAVQPPEEEGGPGWPGDPANILPPERTTVLDPPSLRDLTRLVEDGELTWTAPEGDWILFAFWSRDTRQGEEEGAASLFDATSIRTAAEYVGEHQVGAANTDLLRAVGGSFFEDSLELQAQSVFWANDLAEEFRGRRGYDLTKYLPLIFAQGMSIYWVPEDEPVPDFDMPSDGGDRVRRDFYRLLDDLYADEHVAELADWAAQYDMRFRTQAAFGQNLNVSRGAREVAWAGGLADDESLNAGGWFDPPYDTSVEGWWRFAFDHHRSVSGGSHQGRENEISSELGASRLPFEFTLGNYKQLMDNEWAAGITRPILHGYNYQAVGAEWPGTSRFRGRVSETWNADTYPQWPMWEPLADYWARGAQVLQSGTARTDVAILYDGFVTTAAQADVRTPPKPLFDALGIEEQGYSVAYLDSVGVAEPRAQGDGTLYPHGPRYRALVVDQDALLPATAEAMADQAERGLAIVFVGDLPDHAATNTAPAAADKRVRDAIERMLVERSVVRVERQADAGAALAGLGVRPDAEPAEPVQVYSQHRETTDSDLYYVYNPTPSPVAFDASFAASGRPHELDLWTGEIAPVAEYRTAADRVTVPLELEPGEHAVLGFPKGEPGAEPHVVASDAQELEVADGTVVVRDTRPGTRSVRFSDGTTAEVTVPALPEPLTPGDWDLIVEEVGPEENPPTHDLDLTGLPDWRSIEALEGASGTGTYTTTVTLPGDWTAAGRGAYLDIGRVAGGSTQVYVNGRLASPSPVAGEPIDVSPLLREGDNAIRIVFASTLRNKVTAVEGEGPTQAYGVRGPVRLIPFGRVAVDRDPRAKVKDLETNAERTPLGIDDAEPRLQWRLDSDRRGTQQRKYRVRVATSRRRALHGRADVWDSGVVRSGEPFADYDGPALDSRTRYHWTVRIWAKGDRPTRWARPTWFETAYLDPSEWRGTWISGPPRTTEVLSDAEAFADDACCTVVDTTLASPAAAGDENVKVWGISAIQVGSTLTIGDETATVGSVGTAASSTALEAATAAGATTFAVDNEAQIAVGDRVTIDTGATAEEAAVEAVEPGGRRTPTIVTVASPLQHPHAEGAAVFNPGTGVDLTAPLASAHPADTAVTGTGTPEDFCRPSYDSPNSGACKEIRPAPFLRKAFSVAPRSEHGRVVSARVYASGLGWNDMTLNGEEADEDAYLNPAFTSYDQTVLYSADNVTALIRQDRREPRANVIASQLGSGRYDNEAQSGDHGWERAHFRANPTLRADVHVTYADGTEQVIGTDETWKTSDAGPIRYDNYDLGETYDARKAIPSWDEADFDASGWAAARTVDGPAGEVRAQQVDETAEVAEWAAGERSEPQPGIHLWDTGQQRVGWATVSVDGAEAGTPIQIRYAEKLGEDGLVSISGYKPDGQIQTDYYVADGSGREQFTPRFTFKGFQYIQISGVAGAPLPDGVTVDVESVHEVRTDMAPAGRFASSSAMLELIEHNTRESIEENFVAGLIMDTPTYEKDGWAGDAQLTTPAAALMFDTRRQNRHTTQNIVDDQYEDGQVSLLTPGNAFYGYYSDESVDVFKPDDGGSTPIWDALLFVSPWQSYLRFGDDRNLASAYPHMKRYLTEWITHWFAADGDEYDHTLTSGLGDWSSPNGDDAPDGSATDLDVDTINAASSTAYVAHLAKIAADSARALGKRADARQFDRLYEEIKEDFNAKWWDESVGYYRDDAEQPFLQTFQVLPLAFDLVPRRERRGLQEKLVHDVLVTRAGHQMTGIAGARWIYPVLSDAAYEGVPDAVEAAYTAAQQTTYPSYGYWASLGWTSLGEIWESDSRTRNHHMFGSISQWFYEDLAGIRPTEAGYRAIEFRPTIGDGIDHAEASYDSVRGKVSAAWRQTRRGLVYRVTVPANATGTVRLPAGRRDEVIETGGRRPVPAHRAPGVRRAWFNRGHAVYRVESGRYVFRVTARRRR